MSKFLRFNLKEHCYFVTSTTRDNIPIFFNDENTKLLCNCIYNFRNQGRYLLLGFVIMSTHFHALLVPQNGYNISQVMHSIKRSSSRLLVNKNQGKIWQISFYEHVIRNTKQFYEKLDYIHNNPVKAGIVDRAEDYIFSSANSKNETDIDKYWVGNRR